MRLDERQRNVLFWSEAIRYLATCCHSRVILFGEIESTRLVIPAKAGISLSVCHPEQRKGSMEVIL